MLCWLYSVLRNYCRTCWVCLGLLGLLALAWFCWASSGLAGLRLAWMLLRCGIVIDDGALCAFVHLCCRSNVWSFWDSSDLGCWLVSGSFGSKRSRLPPSPPIEMYWGYWNTPYGVVRTAFAASAHRCIQHHLIPSPHPPSPPRGPCLACSFF
jgi:hypothetical protein